MKTFFKTPLLAAISLASILVARTGWAADETAGPKLNQLTPGEKSAGWKLLFDGQSTKGWRNFRKPTFPEKGWVIEDGSLKHVAGAGGGDIISADEFTDFDLQWEWRVPAKANNGLKYFITEERKQAVGHEYQMIDDWRNADGMRGPKWQTASFYDVLPPQKKTPLKAVGEWNHSRVLVQGQHVEHWLNGEKVLEYELGSDALKAAVAQSKFKNVEGFGTKIKGHILLTDHRDEASYRNLKIRELPVK